MKVNAPPSERKGVKPALRSITLKNHQNGHLRPSEVASQISTKMARGERLCKHLYRAEGACRSSAINPEQATSTNTSGKPMRSDWSINQPETLDATSPPKV